MTPDFLLRPIRADDIDDLVALDSDPEVVRHITGGAPTPRALVEDLLMPRMLSAATRPGLGFFAVESPDLEFLGWMHLRHDGLEPTWAELGYRLKRAVWGQGLATAASRLLMARAFDALGFQTVCARTVAENLASRRVMEKIGLRYHSDFVYEARALPGLLLPEAQAVLYTASRSSETTAGA